MYLIQRPRGTSNAGTLGLFAILGALATGALAVVQVWNDGAAATVERAAWWLRFGLAEAAFVLVLGAAWLLQRRRRA